MVLVQASFTGGEVTPKIYSRSNLEPFKNSAACLENFIIWEYGGLERRPGTQFIYETKNSNKKSVLVPFVFSTTQAYILEFGDLYMRVYKDGGLVAGSETQRIANPTLNTATGWTPTVGTGTITWVTGGGVKLTGNAYVSQSVTTPSGDYRVVISTDVAAKVTVTGSSGTVFITKTTAAGNDQTFTFNSTDASFTVKLEAVSNTPTITKLEAYDTIFEMATPFTENDIANLKFVQSADQLYLVDGNNHPKVVSRTGHANWTIADVDFLDGPYLDENTTSTTLTPSATSGNITITASSALFSANDVGRLVAINNGSAYGYAKITAYSSPTSVSATVKKGFAAATAINKWKLGAFVQGSGPKAITFASERLCFGGTKLKPQTFYASNTARWNDFAYAATAKDTDPIVATMASGQVNHIRWMEQYKDSVMIGTSDSLWRLYSTDTTKIFSQTSLKQERILNSGSSSIQGRQVNSTILYSAGGNERINELAYVYETDGYSAPAMTLLAEHIARGGIKQFAYQSRPNQVVWFVREDGQLLGFTYMRDQKVTGWHRHVLGGGGKVESVAVIPSSDDKNDELWMITKRTINGQTKRYVERMALNYERQPSVEDWFYVDCGLTYSGAPATTISGLTHLEGQTVQVFADGAHHPDRVVTGGKITLQEPKSKVTIGLQYKSVLQTLRAEGNPAATILGKRKVIHKVILDVYESVNGSIGVDLDNLDEFQTVPTHDCVVPYTGWQELLAPGGWDTEGQIYVVQDRPVTLNIRAIQLVMSGGDK